MKFDKRSFFNPRDPTFYLFLSLVFHILLFLFFNNSLLTTKPVAPKPLFVELKKILPENPQQIVDSDKPKNEEKPDQAKAQALYDQNVKKETVAASPQKSQQISSKVENNKKKVASPSQPAKKTIPKKEESPQSAGGDYLPGFKIGDRTYIDTQANPNIGYFVEIKRKFSIAWNPARILKNLFPRPSQVSCVLGVSVDSRGNLAKIITIRPSSVEGYDNEAMRTVRASAPFSSPPKNLLSSDNQLHMAWTFIVHL